MDLRKGRREEGDREGGGADTGVPSARPGRGLVKCGNWVRVTLIRERGGSERVESVK